MAKVFLIHGPNGIQIADLPTNIADYPIHTEEVSDNVVFLGSPHVRGLCGTNISRWDTTEFVNVSI